MHLLTGLQQRTVLERHRNRIVEVFLKSIHCFSDCSRTLRRIGLREIQPTDSGRTLPVADGGTTRISKSVAFKGGKDYWRIENEYFVRFHQSMRKEAERLLGHKEDEKSIYKRMEKEAKMFLMDDLQKDKVVDHARIISSEHNFPSH
eukprot:Gb_18028 [translate_table: standard]